MEEVCPYLEEGKCNLLLGEPQGPCNEGWRYCPLVRFQKRFGPSKLRELVVETRKAGFSSEELYGAVCGLMYGLAVREKPSGDRAWPGYQVKKLLEFSKVEPEREDKLLEVFERVLGREVLEK